MAGENNASSPTIGGMLNFFRRDKPNSLSPSLARKARSIELLKARNVPFIEHLPHIDDESAIKPRSSEEVLRRARGCLIYFMRGQFAMDNVPLADFRDKMAELQSWNDLTPAERVVAEAETLTQQQIVDTSWALESINVLAWTLGIVSALDWPDKLCDLPTVVNKIRHTRDSTGLKLIGLTEILDQTDLHYRLHWTCRDRSLRGQEPPCKLLHSVILARRQALEWVTDSEADWDNPELST